MLPKFKGENYFDACYTGAKEAVAELNASGGDVTLLYDGPPQNQATNQNQVNILNGWIAQKVNVIILSADDPTAIAPTLQKAQQAGIKVITFDADAQADSRDLFVNQVTADGVAKGLLDAVEQSLTAKGYGPSKPANIALISSAKTDANQQSWLASIKTLLATSDYSWLKLQNESTDVYYPGPDETTNQTQAATLIGRMGAGTDQIQAAIGLTSMATPALGSAYSGASSKPDANAITITGLATPNALKSYILDPTNPLKTGVIWNCMNLGYLAVESGYQMGIGTITSDSTSISTPRLGTIDISDKTVVLGPALIFNAENVNDFNY
jgi:ABC-type sugar transport system substrate-binding protein